MAKKKDDVEDFEKATAAILERANNGDEKAQGFLSGLLEAAAKYKGTAAYAALQARKKKGKSMVNGPQRFTVLLLPKCPKFGKRGRIYGPGDYVDLDRDQARAKVACGHGEIIPDK